MATSTPDQRRAAPAGRRLAFTVAAALALCGACDLRPPRGDAGDADVIRAAVACEQQGDLDSAIAEYESAIRLHPDAALAHMNLGLLLQEYRRDYVGAIYHYRTYLALRPSTQKKSIVEDHLRQATQLLGAELAKDLVRGGDNAILIQQLQKEQQKVNALQSEKSALSAELEDAKGQIARLEAERDHLQRRVDMLSAAPLPSSVQEQGQGRIVAAQGGSSEVRTYTVKKGDSLSHIAEMVYGDPAQWPRIKKANEDAIKGDRVREGTVLTIP